MSSTSLSFDASAAHRHFSAECFNNAWQLMEKTGRTTEEDEEMILCALASLWHWMQRSDVTDRNLSIGHWQVSRAFALSGQGENSMRHGEHSLAYAKELSPFYLGYAHEAIARAAGLLNDEASFRTHLQNAQDLAAKVEDQEERSALDADLHALATRWGKA